MSWPQDNPLAQIKGETLRSNRALWDYANMGPGRSLAKLLEVYKGQNGGKGPGGQKPPTTRGRTLEVWSSRWSWQERLRRWEDLNKAKEAAAWEQRRERFRELAYTVAERSLERVATMLDYPLTQRIVAERDDSGRPVKVIVEPTNWNIGSAARLLAEANKAGLLALGEITDRTENTLRGQIGVHGDLSALEDTELDDLIGRQLDKLAAVGPGEIRNPFTGEGEPEATGGGGPASEG